MSKYPIWTEDEEVAVPGNGLFKMGCCSCGLCHLLKFGHDEAGNITMRVYRLGRSTGQMRRWMKRKKEGIWGNED